MYTVYCVYHVFDVAAGDEIIQRKESVCAFRDQDLANQYVAAWNDVHAYEQFDSNVDLYRGELVILPIIMAGAQDAGRSPRDINYDSGWRPSKTDSIYGQ